MTNREKLNSLTNEELVLFISFFMLNAGINFEDWLYRDYDAKMWNAFVELTN